MNFQRLRFSFSQLKNTSTALAVSNAVLVALLGGSLFVNFQKDTIVINNLNESCQESMISSSWMNEGNHKRLGVYLAGMLGNITPDSAGFVENSVLPFAAPEIYQRVNDLIALQTASLVEDEVTMSFNAEKVFVEDGITFVSGKGEMKGLNDQPKKYVRTYEFFFEVNNYTPTFTYIDVYDDVPHDSIWRSKHQKAEDK